MWNTKRARTVTTCRESEWLICPTAATFGGLGSEFKQPDSNPDDQKRRRIQWNWKPRRRERETPMQSLGLFCILLMGFDSSKRRRWRGTQKRVGFAGIERLKAFSLLPFTVS